MLDELIPVCKTPDYNLSNMKSTFYMLNSDFFNKNNTLVYNWYLFKQKGPVAEIHPKEQQGESNIPPSPTSLGGSIL